MTSANTFIKKDVENFIYDCTNVSDITSRTYIIFPVMEIEINNVQDPFPCLSLH